ncbi:MAG: ATP-dependent nuclease [Smithellaceae bacterium]
MKELIDRITRAKSSGIFENYLEYVRFPFYKNLEENTKINFEFPFTVFTGRNGSGKSSVLHAIQGAPGGESPAKFWFSTKVDPINDTTEKPNCFIYGYQKDSALLEVLKTRINLKDKPDYWEPSRPIKKYGMTLLKGGKRNPTINKKVIYFDFRAELSAYDKYFYFSDLRKTLTIQSKQDYIRRYSPKLKSIIDNNFIHLFRGRPVNEKPIHLSNNELKEICKILGKEYKECRLVEHSLFNKNKGLTIFFKTDSINYSEAYAGRGEFAVVRLVREVMNAPEHSLLVLDEPEVSLHPGAQEALKIFLLRQTLNKKLQVIISTHAPKFVEYLPESAIKLFYPTTSGKFTVRNKTNYIEAFHFIGQETENKIIVFVEDKLSKLLMEKVIESLGGEYILLIKVEYNPGGAKSILKSAVQYSEENELSKYLLLDGDERKAKIDPLSISVSDSQNLPRLQKLIKDATGIEHGKLRFRIDGKGEEGGDTQQKINSAMKYLSYLWTNLDYLPGDATPELLIWNVAYAEELLRAKGKEFTAETFNGNSKNNFYSFTKQFFEDTTSNDVNSSHKLFIQKFCELKDTKYECLVNILARFKSQWQTYTQKRSAVK